MKPSKQTYGSPSTVVVSVSVKHSTVTFVPSEYCPTAVQEVRGQVRYIRALAVTVAVTERLAMICSPGLTGCGSGFGAAMAAVRKGSRVSIEVNFIERVLEDFCWAEGITTKRTGLYRREFATSIS